MRPKPNRRSAFSLIELVVVILILAILAGALVPRVTNRLAISRDLRRLTDLRELRGAIERFYLDRGVYPPPTVAEGGSGYDVSTDKDFIPELVKSGYLRAAVADPINDADCFYAYNVFDEGTHGCKGKGKFYVLGIKKFESAGFAAAHPGYFKCSQKDWSVDFEYVTGGAPSDKGPKAAILAGAK